MLVEIINSNVWKMYTAVIRSPEQIAFYDSGVGVDKRIIPRILGGAFGDGIDNSVKQGYTRIAEVYKSGDDIFLFGWSRGAYMLRALASMICDVGFPTQYIDSKMIDELFFFYQNPIERESLLADLKKQYRFINAPIKFVGVLDTVGSLGLSAIDGGVNQTDYGFLNTRLHPNIANAYQAMAIDECRRQFPITLWDEPACPVDGQVLEQVWFAGCHDDIGGGYLDLDPKEQSGLAELPLRWMAKKVSSLGLQIDPYLLTETPIFFMKKALSPIHETWSLLDGERAYRAITNDAKLSNSVADRCEYNSTYRPVNLRFVDDKLAESYCIVNTLDTEA